MDLSMLFQRVGKVAAQNTPAILTALGVSGTLTTAYLAAKAGFKSVEALKTVEDEKNDAHRLEWLEEHQDVSALDDDKPWGTVELTKREKFEAVWELYAPSAATAALTVAAIILASRVQERRTAAMTAAYTTIERSYTEYRAKAVEKMGKKKEEELRAAISQDQIDRNPPTSNTIIVTGKGNSLCKDGWSGRFFYSTVTEVDRAVNEFNSKVLRDGYGSVSEFWSYLDLPPVDGSDLIGWSSDKILEIEWDGAVSPDSEPALKFSFRVLPNPRFASAY